MNFWHNTCIVEHEWDFSAQSETRVLPGDWHFEPGSALLYCSGSRAEGPPQLSAEAGQMGNQGYSAACRTTADRLAATSARSSLDSSLACS